jgi:hypothetical protein
MTFFPMVQSAMDFKTATAADFEKLVGQSFSVAGFGDCELRLDQVDALVKQDESVRQPFTLVFKGEHAQSLEQGMFELHHAEAGVLQIFLVPIGPSDGVFLYEAVFN